MSFVEDFWSTWSKNAEAGLFRAYALAGGPTAAGSSAFLGKELLRIRSRHLGGRAVGSTGSRRLYRTCQNDEFDKHCAQFFVTFSLSPVLLFRGRFRSVADVIKGIRSKGFTQFRWDALLRYSHSRFSRIIVEPHLFDAEFRKVWMSFFCRSGHPDVSAEQFLDFIGLFLFKRITWIFSDYKS